MCIDDFFTVLDVVKGLQNEFLVPFVSVSYSTMYITKFVAFLNPSIRPNHLGLLVATYHLKEH